MTEKASSFRSVMRGYDPAQVDAHLSELTTALESARREAADRTIELSRSQTAHADLNAELDVARSHALSLEEAQGSAGQPSYQELGERIGQILHLADQEANDLRATAAADAEAHRASASAEAEAHRASVAADAAGLQAETTRYVEELRAKAEAEAAALLEDARRRADEMIDDADRRAQTRREEGEALYDSQSAKVAASASDWETALTERRDKAAAEFAAQLAVHNQRLTEARATAQALEQESATAHTAARAQAESLLESARAEASQVMKAAEERAERARTESERDLAAAISQRDSINSQLANVRQVLATLGGTALPQQDSPDVETAPATSVASRTGSPAEVPDRLDEVVDTGEPEGVAATG
ncbi:MAG: DivIVA domain-containing protein [Actinomycetota bacterium]|nr:DivIVA domain-containing protein [Actinomycetota bacterium]